MSEKTKEFTLYTIDGDFGIKNGPNNIPFITVPRVNVYTAIDDKPHHFTVMLMGIKVKIKKAENEGRVFFTLDATKVELRAMRQRLIDSLKTIMDNLSSGVDIPMVDQPPAPQDITL